MKTIKSTHLILISLILALTACSSSPKGEKAANEYNQAPLSVNIPTKLTPEKVQKSITNTLLGRKWNIVSVTDEEVVGELIHRGIHGKVTLKAEGNKVSIYSDSYSINREGIKVKPAVPMGWLRNLQADLLINLSFTKL